MLKTLSIIAPLLCALSLTSAGENTGYKVFKDKAVTASEKGLMTMYLSEDKVYMEIPLSLLDKELLFGTTVVASSDERESTAGIQPRPPKLVRFHCSDSTTVLLQELNFVSFSDDAGISAALEESSAPSTLALFKAEEFNRDSTAVLCDASSIFSGDKDYLSPKYLGGYNSMGGYITRDYTYKSDNSFIKSVHADAGSVSVDTEMSYFVTRALFAIMKISEDTPFSAVVRTSFVELPHTDEAALPLEKGLGAGRVSLLKYDSSTNGAKRHYYATRWAVRDKSAPLVEFILDDDMPATVENAARRAAEIWNGGFRREGFTEAVRVSAHTTPRSTYSSTIDYVRTPGKEIKSSVWTDPRNGNIFKAAIHIDHDVCKRIQYDLMVMCSHADPSLISVTADQAAVEDCLTSMLVHHIGRCLGFRVNLYGSAAVPVETLRRGGALTESVMDEVRLNYLIDPSLAGPEAALCQTGLGRFDLYNINHLYGDASMDDAGYLFLPDGLEPSDPRAQSAVLGDDLPGAAALAVENLLRSLSRANALLDTEDYDFEVRSALLDAYVEHYFLVSESLLPCLGGVHYTEIIPGNRRYVPVPLADQEKALAKTLEIMDGSSALDSNDLIGSVGLNDRLSDYVAFDIFSALLRKSASLSSEPGDEGVTMTRSRAMDRIMDHLWKDSLKGKPVTSVRKKMQQQYVDKLADMVKETGAKDAPQVYALCRKNLDILSRSAWKARDKSEKTHYQYLYGQRAKYKDIHE